MPRRTSAFTLIELLVVIAIIALLMALLLPALQKVREAGNKSKCGANLNQIALAANSYENDNGGFPYATKADVLDAYNWSHLLLPYLDNKPVYAIYTTIGGPITQTTDWPGAQGFGNGATEEAQFQVARNTPITVFICPSDRKPVLNEAGSRKYSRQRGNYRGCAGSGDLYGALPAGGTGYTPGRGIYSVNRGQIFGTAAAPLQTTATELTNGDGVSTTMMFSECLRQTTDAWGTISDITIGNMGAAFFSTFTTPNSSTADRPWGPCPGPQGDTGYLAPCSSLGGPNRPPGAHNNNQRTAFATARSAHNGGVNIVMADRTVIFVKNSVSVGTWRALGTKGLNDIPGTDY
jgi:prepilin-type N-terminal cleavage/methylation domain-containing protein